MGRQGCSKELRPIWSRLGTGEKTNPSTTVLARLGLRGHGVCSLLKGCPSKVTPLIGLFGEYRLRTFETQHEFAGPVQLSETFNTHHLIGGLSFRF